MTTKIEIAICEAELRIFLKKHAFNLDLTHIRTLSHAYTGYKDALEIAQNRKEAIKALKNAFGWCFAFDTQCAIAKDIKLLKQSLKYNLKEARYHANIFNAKWQSLKHLH